MGAWIVVPLPSRFHLHLVAIFLMTLAMTVVVRAQTLTNPNPKSHTQAAPSQQKKQAKSCPAYGAGFVQFPGSDVCVKIGGYVQGEISGFGR
jgi:Porin subfamily